ncbi:MAG: prepilin peptidase [Burkholderiaceae bacterium]|nr:prepilin peptidase [Burkholderiaceae bacterium]
MLSLGVGQWQAWVMCCFIGLLGVFGGLSGLFSARLARAYVNLLAGGAYPDQTTFCLALRRATWPLGSSHQEADQHAYGQAEWRGIILMAGVVPLLCWRSGLSVYFVALLAAAVVLLTLALIDAACSLLPDALTLPLLWGGLALSWLGYGPALSDAFAGVMLGYGFPWALFFVYKCARRCDGMGHGDFKLLAGLGAWLGWQAVAPVLLMASVGLVTLAIWRQKSWRPVGACPFGPFLIVSAAGVFVGGSGVHSWFI